MRKKNCISCISLPCHATYVEITETLSGVASSEPYSNLSKVFIKTKHAQLPLHRLWKDCIIDFLASTTHHGPEFHSIMEINGGVGLGLRVCITTVSR